MSLTPPSGLDGLARLAVRTGLNLSPGQQLIIAAPLEAVDLVRKVTEQAYMAGASLVTTFYADDETTLARYRHADESTFDTAASWLSDGITQGLREGAARLAITGGNPGLLAGQDPEKISRASRSASKASRAAMELITGMEVNWNVLAAATPAWADLVFPDAEPGTAVPLLWDAILKASRALGEDPVAEWAAHDALLHARADWLNDLRFASLHFTGPGTDLTVGLADGHRWAGGSSKTKSGITCTPNIPTEEVFTTPHSHRVDGYVSSTKPLSCQGALINDIRMTFEGGRVVEATSSSGQTVLTRLIDTDEGARRLGEVALVPHSSPISQSGLLFQNTLFDENAASHIALGQAYTECMQRRPGQNAEDLVERGANESLIHVDWMIGSGEIDVDGITASGEAVAVMRKGEWVTSL